MRKLEKHLLPGPWSGRDRPRVGPVRHRRDGRSRRPPPDPRPTPTARPPLLSRRPSLRVTAALAVGMLAVGVGVGAAVGPAPTASFAGDTPALIAKLISELAAARSHSSRPRAASPRPKRRPKPR